MSASLSCLRATSQQVKCHGHFIPTGPNQHRNTVTPFRGCLSCFGLSPTKISTISEEDLKMMSAISPIPQQSSFQRPCAFLDIATRDFLQSQRRCNPRIDQSTWPIRIWDLKHILLDHIISIIYNQNKGWFQYINCLMIKTYCLLGHLWSSFLLVITNLHLLKDILTIHNCRSALWFKSLQHGSRITFDFMSHMKSPPSLCKGSAGTFPGCGAGHR